MPDAVFAVDEQIERAIDKMGNICRRHDEVIYGQHLTPARYFPEHTAEKVFRIAGST